MRKRDWKTITEEEIRTEYVDKIGATIASTAKALGCSYRACLQALAHYGYTPKPKSNKWTKSHFPKLADKVWLENELKTKSFRHIAKELGTSAGNVADHAYRHGIRCPATNKSEAVRAALRKRYPNGRRGPEASNWRGGRVYRGNGTAYVMIYRPDHPYADKAGYVMEHRLVMEGQLGRHLLPNEVVHHKNGVKDDNRPENLELMQTRGQHVRHHFEDVKRVAALEAENAALRSRLAELENTGPSNGA